MKKSGKGLMAILVMASMIFAGFMITLPNAGAASFGTDIRVNDSGDAAFVQSAPDTAIDGNDNIYVVWHDNRNGNYDIYISKSTDDGVTFNTDVRIDNNGADQQNPAIYIDKSNNVCIIWQDFRSGNWDIYFSKSTNGGASFGPPVQVSDAGGTSEQSYPDITVAGDDNIYVVWQDNRFGGWDIYFAVSTDDGDSFDANVRVNTNPSPTIDQQFPSVAVNTEDAVFVVWQDDRNGDDEIYSARSTNDGDSFQTETKVSDDTDDEDQRYPALAIDDSNNIYVAWEDYRSGSNWDIYLATSNNNGNSFGTNVRVNDNSNDNQRRPLVSVDADDHLHAVWYDTRGVFDYIYYVKSTDNGESFGTDTRVCSASGRAILVPPAIAVNSVMEPCIAWTDSRNGNDDVYFSRGVNNAPSCTIFNPAAGSMVSGAVTVSGTASDSDGNEELVQVEVRIDDGTWNTATGTTTWSYDLSTFTLTNGQHVIYARAYDGALYSDLVDVTIIVANAGGNQAPTVSITSPAANEEITGNYVIEGAASDPDGDTQVELVEIRIDNGSWESAIPVAGQNNWTAWVYYLDFSSLSLGEHTIHARSYDGMIYSTEASVTVTLATSDTNNDVFCISIIIIIILLAALLLLLLMRRKEKPVETYHPVQQQEWQGEYVEPGPEMPPTQP